MTTFPLDSSGYTAGHGWRPLRLKEPPQKGWDVYDLQCKLNYVARPARTACSPRTACFGPHTKARGPGLPGDGRAGGGHHRRDCRGADAGGPRASTAAQRSPHPDRVHGPDAEGVQLLCGIYTAEVRERLPGHRAAPDEHAVPPEPRTRTSTWPTPSASWSCGSTSTTPSTSSGASPTAGVGRGPGLLEQPGVRRPLRPGAERPTDLPRLRRRRQRSTSEGVKHEASVEPAHRSHSAPAGLAGFVGRPDGRRIVAPNARTLEAAVQAWSSRSCERGGLGRIACRRGLAHGTTRGEAKASA